MDLTPYTWDVLGTMAGAMAATLLVVQYLKAPLDTVWKIPTRVFVYIVALVIMLCSQAFTVGLTWAGIPLTALNALMVALSTMGAYELTFAKVDAA